MIDIFLFALNCIAPVIIMIALGFFLRRIRLIDDAFLKTGNRFVFFVALPVLLFYNVYNIGSLGEIEWGAVAFSVAVIAVLFFAGLVAVTFCIKQKNRKGVVLQCIFRSNFAIVGLPLAASIGGVESLSTAAVLSAFTIPVFNIFAIVALSVFAENENGKTSISDVVLDILKNPLIIGVVSGLICLVIRRIIPVDEAGNPVFSIKNNIPALYTVIKWGAEVASPLALIVLGGQFEFSAVKELKYEIVFGTLARIVIAPLVGVGTAVVFTICGIAEFGAAHFPAFIALFGSPVAVSSAIMAAEMKGDAVLARQYVVWTTLGSAFTIFMAVVILRALGFI